MAGKRAEPRADQRLPAAAPTQRGEPVDAAERTGPLLLERLRKADGRALILYRVDRAEPERE
jgi:hypothetical protein